MIVVLGPAELAEALVATAPGELVVGARDDERLGQDVVEAVEVASALPLPARACIVAAWNDPVLACEAIRTVGGSLAGARLYVIGDPPPGMEIAVWNIQMGRTGAVPVRDMDVLRDLLEGHGGPRMNGNGSNGNGKNGHGRNGHGRNGQGAVESIASNGQGAKADKPSSDPGTVSGAGAAADDVPEVPARTAAERRAMRPGAPEAAAWRAALRAAPTGRLSKVMRRRGGLTDKPLPEVALDATIRRPLRTGCRSVAVLSPKGGVGKTTLTYLVGSAIARVRRERVLVVDTNPDFGTLADLAPAIVPATISDLVRDLDGVESYEDLGQYTTTTETGMQILSAPQDPVEMERLGCEGYEAVSNVLHRHYDLVIYDCGTGFLDELTQFALRRVDHVVLVTTPSLVTTKIVVGAVDHLGATGFEPTRTTLAVNMVRRDDLLDRRRLRVALTGRIGGSVEVPYDRRVQRTMDAGEFQYSSLGHTTRLATKRLAAAVIGRMPAREKAPEVSEPLPADDGPEASAVTEAVAQADDVADATTEAADAVLDPSAETTPVTDAGDADALAEPPAPAATVAANRGADLPADPEGDDAPLEPAPVLGPAHPEFPAWPIAPIPREPSFGPTVSRYTFTLPGTDGASDEARKGGGARTTTVTRHGRRLAFDWDPVDSPGE